MLVDGVLDRLADPFADLLFEIGALEDFAALAVDNLALLVHDVVVLDQITAGGGVVAPPPCLGAPPLSRGPPRLHPPPRPRPPATRHCPSACWPARAPTGGRAD